MLFSSFFSPYKSLSRYKLSILLGNVIDHYDSALYGFLAPLLAPYFFPQEDPFVSILYAYAVLSTSFVTVPVGAFLFGRWAHIKGPLEPLSFSLLGVGVSTMLIGFLPTHALLGIFAPCILVLVRIIREICASGEITIASLYILESTPREEALPTSSAYQVSIILGILLASCMGGGIALLPTDYPYWRIPFILGGCASLIGLYLRKQKIPTILQNPFLYYTEPQKTLVLLGHSYKTLLRIALVVGLSYSTYAFPFVFMSSFIPEVTSLSYSQMMNASTLFLIIDGILLLVLGHLLRFYTPTLLMHTGCWILAFSTPLLFVFIQDAGFIYVSFIRFWIVFWGIVFLSPLNVWLFQQRQGLEKYLLVGIGSAIGSGLFGKIIPFLCLYIWHLTHTTYAPALYMSFLGISVGISIMKFKK